jgi:hypothetical protein
MSELDSLCILRVRICMNLTILRPADLQPRRELLDGGRAWRPCRVRLGCAITASRRQAECDEVHLHNLGESFTLLPEFSARRLFSSEDRHRLHEILLFSSAC